jgi:hypothetical protein
MTSADVCARFGARPSPPHPDEKLGIALRSLGLLPLNGLRHKPERGTCGWYLWAGQHLSDAPDFFDPLHVSHIGKYCADAIPYLALPPGWRFLIAPGHEDVWFDENLLLATE